LALADSDGKVIRLSQLRGKTVLLSFWSSSTPASLDDAPALKNRRQRYPDRLAVLGVCIPAAQSCADEHEHGHGHGHHHHDESGGGAGTEHMGCSVRDAVARLKINYPMIADTNGAVGQRFSVGDLPAYVLIDAEGMVRRRFVGFRTESVLAAMVEEAGTPGAAQASAN
jgi:peroxiredoxin